MSATPTSLNLINSVISDEETTEAENKSQNQDDHNTEQTPNFFDSYIYIEVALPRG